MLFHPYAKDISEGNQEWKLPHLARTQKSNIVKHLTPSIATALGHIEQERKNLQSKKQVKYKLDIDEDKYFNPDMETVKAHELCATIIPFNAKIKGFIDLTGV